MKKSIGVDDSKAKTAGSSTAVIVKNEFTSDYVKKIFSKLPK